MQIDAQNAALNDLFWQWWDLPTFKISPKYSLWTDIMSLSDLGSGIPLYFYFIKFTVIVFMIHGWLVGLPAIIITSALRGLSGGNCFDKEYAYSLPNIFIVSTNSLFIFILFIMYTLFSKFQTDTNRKIDENNIAPSDFTVMAFNIPLQTTKEELK